MTTGDEDDLGRAFRQGVPEAVTRVRDRVGRILAFRGYRIPAEERRDLQQEVMAQIWRAANRAGFDPARGFLGFVEVVTARRCIDWLRTRRQDSELQPDHRDERPDPFAVTLAGERARLAAAVLARLREPCRELIALHIVEHKPYSEVARILGRSEGALRVQMYRCIREARRILDELMDAADSTGRRQR